MESRLLFIDCKRQKQATSEKSKRQAAKTSEKDKTVENKKLLVRLSFANINEGLDQKSAIETPKSAVETPISAIETQKSAVDEK